MFSSDADRYPIQNDRCLADKKRQSLTDAVGLDLQVSPAAMEAARRVLDTVGQVFQHWLPMASPQYRNMTEGLKARLTTQVKGYFAAMMLMVAAAMVLSAA